MVDFNFNIDAVYDSMVTGDESYLKAELDGAREAVFAGGKVILERRYVNAKPEPVKTINNTAEFLAWVKHLNNITKFNLSF